MIFKRGEACRNCAYEPTLSPFVIYVLSLQRPRGPNFPLHAQKTCIGATCFQIDLMHVKSELMIHLIILQCTI